MSNNNLALPLSLRRKSFLIVFGLFLFLIVLELVLRLGGFIFLTIQDYKNKVSLNQGGTTRIMCIGESTTAIGGQDSYPSQLEDVLNEGHLGITFSVINKGVPGIDTSYILSCLEANLDRYRPHMVIAMMGINDAPRSEYQKHITFRVDQTPASFFASLRITKLAKLLGQHARARIREINTTRSKEKRDALSLMRKNSLVENNPLTHKPDPQEEFLKKAIQLNPKDERAYEQLGLYYAWHEKYAQLKEISDKVLRINPKNDVAYTGLGWVYTALEDFTKAEECYKKSLALNLKNDGAYFGLGWLYVALKDFTKAQTCYRKAIQLNPKNDLAYVGIFLT